MNIALVNPEYNTQSGIGHGGIATYTYNIANALSNKGHSIFLFLREGITPDPLNNNIKVIEYNRAPLPLFRRLIRKLCFIDNWEEEFSYGLYERVLSVHKSEHLDIVDIPEYNGLAAAFNRKTPFSLVINFRTPRIIVNQFSGTKITSADKRIYNLEKRSIKVTKNYRTSSQALKERICKLYNISADKVVVVRNPMQPQPPFLKQNSNKIKILFVGRLEQRKGLELIKKSIPDIFNISDKIELHIAGETTNEIKNCLRLNAGSKNNKRLIFHGAIDHSSLQDIYNSSDIFIFPSVFDNSPNALLEAMASSLPIVASDAPGVNEIIKDNENGLLFETENKDSFLNKLKILIENDGLKARLSKNALSDIHEIFAPDKIATETLKFYTTLLQREQAK